MPRKRYFMKIGLAQSGAAQDPTAAARPGHDATPRGQSLLESVPQRFHEAAEFPHPTAAQGYAVRCVVWHVSCRALPTLALARAHTRGNPKK